MNSYIGLVRLLDPTDPEQANEARRYLKRGLARLRKLKEEGQLHPVQSNLIDSFESALARLPPAPDSAEADPTGPPTQRNLSASQQDLSDPQANPGNTAKTLEPGQEDQEAVKKQLVAVLLQQVSQQYKAGKYQDAILLLNKASTLDENNAVVYWLRGQLFFQQEQCDSAIADFEQVNRLLPEFADAFGARGWCLILQGRFTDALQPTQKAQAAGNAAGRRRVRARARCH